MQRTGRLSAWVEIHASENWHLSAPPPFLLPELSFHTPTPYRSWGRRREDSRHRKIRQNCFVLQTKVFFLSKKFLSSDHQFIVDIFTCKIVCCFFFLNRCHQRDCYTLAGLKSDSFWERSLLSFFPPGMLHSRNNSVFQTSTAVVAWAQLESSSFS